MGFTDEVGVGGGKPIFKFNKEARYVKRGSEDAMNNQEFVAKIHEARAGYIKFNGNDQPERHLGPFSPRTRRRLAPRLATPTRANGPRLSLAMVQKTPGRR